MTTRNFRVHNGISVGEIVISASANNITGGNAHFNPNIDFICSAGSLVCVQDYDATNIYATTNGGFMGPDYSEATNYNNTNLLFNKYGLVSAPVINNQKKIIGSITVDDVVEVIEEEREEDILKLGGVDHTDLYESVVATTRSRISWLIVNLMTAVVASIVIGLFEAAIEKVVALAILMPIVASMGANAGTQTLTVAVRAIAVKELTASNALKIITKETLIGGINGIIFAIIISLISIYWFDNLLLGLIIGLAMILNLLIAGFSGIVIPLVLDKMKIDPALASAVILSTITDVFGFLSFLGLATLFLI